MKIKYVPLVLNDLQDVYKYLKVTDFWYQPNYSQCRQIIKFLAGFIKEHPHDANGYYLRSMAKFNLSTSTIKLADGVPAEQYSKEAYEDYCIAFHMDADIVARNPDIRFIAVSGFTGLKYYFRYPIPRKDFLFLMKPLNDFCLSLTIWPNWLIKSSVFKRILGFFPYTAHCLKFNECITKYCEKTEPASWAEMK